MSDQTDGTTRLQNRTTNEMCFTMRKLCYIKSIRKLGYICTIKL